MKQFLKTLWLGVREPFQNKNFIVLFLVSFFAFFALFVLIPVWTEPFNTLSIQLDIFTARDYALITLLSFLSSIFITMQGYVIRQKWIASGAIGAAAGGLGALFAGIAGTAICVSCLVPIFALFGIGFGGSIFVLEYQWYFVAATTLIMLVAIYLTARKINRICSSC
jgi:hypothetical protein